MKRFLALLLCVGMLLSVTACKKKNQTPPAATPSGTTTTTTATEGESDIAQYALDPVVNRFLNDMVSSGAINSQSIYRTPGAADAPVEELIKSYSATLNGLPITMRNASYEAGEGDETYTVYCLHISIEGGFDQRSKDALMTAFSIVAATLGCNKSSVDSVAATLETATETVQDLRVSGNVKVTSYTPIINDEDKHISVPCRMEIRAFDYHGVEV